MTSNGEELLYDSVIFYIKYFFFKLTFTCFFLKKNKTINTFFYIYTYELDQIFWLIMSREIYILRIIKCVKKQLILF